MGLTMKQRIAAKRGVPVEMRRALTPDQIAQPSCRWFHRWVRVDDSESGSYYAHYQCRKCHDRKAVSLLAPGSGYSAPDSYWVDGREWGWLPPIPAAKSGMRSAVSPPPTPQSTQVTLHEGTAPPRPPTPQDMIRTQRDPPPFPLRPPTQH